MWHGMWIDDTHSFQRVEIQTERDNIKASPGEKMDFDLTITNPYAFPINFKNEGYPHEVIMAACFLQHDATKFPVRAGADFGQFTIAPHKSVHYNFIFKAPPVKGKYDLLFSIRTTPFPGGRNSRAINFTVE